MLRGTIFANKKPNCHTRADSSRNMMFGGFPLSSHFRFAAKIVFIIFFLLALTLPAAAQTWKIMPVGNSITKGVGSTDSLGFRKKLYDNLYNSGINFQFVGNETSAPYKGWFKSGAKIEEFRIGAAYDLVNAINTYQPNMVLIHLGTNNLTSYSVSSAITNLESLLKDFSNISTVQRILLCKIIPRTEWGNPDLKTRDFNAAIDNLFFSRPAGIAWDKITLVDMYSQFTTNHYISTSLFADPKHPNDNGYQKMADEYARVIRGLNQSDVTPPDQIVLGGTATPYAITLSWQSVGDDGGNGKANLYELRYVPEVNKSDPFSTWNLVFLPQPKDNTKEAVTIENLQPDNLYYFRIRAYDEWNNKGSLSSVEFFIRTPDTSRTTVICDDLSDPSKWSANPSCLRIDNGEMHNICTDKWKSLAVYTDAKYPPDIRYAEASFRWSALATERGSTGVAMLLDAPSYSANGYMVYMRSGTVYLYEVINGEAINKISTLYPQSPPAPNPGDEFKVRYNSSDQSFEVFLNNSYLGKLSDPLHRQGSAEFLYSGVMIYGWGDRSNAISEFCITVPPMSGYRLAISNGDPRAGTVGKRLPDALTVMVTDKIGRGVEGVPVDFTVVPPDSGFLSTDPDSIASVFDGNIWIEAESGTLNGPMEVGKDPLASGERFVYATGDNNFGSVNYEIYVPVAGTYKVCLRAYAPDGNQNSCRYAIGNYTMPTDQRWDFGTTGMWYWSSDRSFPLTKGFVNFAIINRESGTRFDKILLTRNGGWLPSANDKGGGRLPFSNITDDQGYAYTFLTFAKKSDDVHVQAMAPVPVDSVQTFTEYAVADAPATMVAISPAPGVDSITRAGTAGQPLSDDFVVKLSDQWSNLVSGITVKFEVTKGGGTLGNGQFSQLVTTDNTGEARARLTLGYDGSENQVKASLLDYASVPPVLFYGIADNNGFPFEIQMVSGNSQMDTVMHVLHDLLRVRVLDTKGKGVAGYKVPFKVALGNGKLNGSSDSLAVPTDSLGEAAVVFKLGDKAGTNNNKVIVNAKRGDAPLAGSPLEFTASAGPDKPDTLIKISGEPQSQHAGFKFAQELVVKVSDQYGNGIKNHSVTFSVQTGTGNFDGQVTLTAGPPKTVFTDSLGKAQVSYSAGNATTTQIDKINANAGTAGLQVFSLTVNPSIPSKLTKISGDNPVQEATVGGRLSTAFKVKVTDPFNNAKSNDTLTFKVESGGGKFDNNLDSTLVSTDANGEAQAYLTLGTMAGFQNQQARVLSRAFSFITPVTFVATAQTGPAAKIAAANDTLFSGDAGGGPASLSVKVTDQYDNPRQGESITFTIDAGTNAHFDHGNATTAATTKADGIATANYYMGTNALEGNVIYAYSTVGLSLQGSPVKFTGTVRPGSPASQAILPASTGQTARIRTILPTPLTATVYDQYGNSVPNVKVHFQVLSQGGAIEGSTEADRTTDQYGQASVSYTLGTKAGSNSDTVKVTVVGFDQIQPVFFYASAEPGDPHKIYAAGDSTWASVQTGKKLTPKAKVVDRYDNAVANWPVTFASTRGGGTVDGGRPDSATVQTTADSGIAQIDWTVGKPDTNKLLAKSRFNGLSLANSPVTFWAWVTAGKPYFMEKLTLLSDTGVVGLKLADSVGVRVTDVEKNPIPHHAVRFEVTGSLRGKISYRDSTAEKLTVYTHNDGTAAVAFTFGSTAGPYGLHVSSTTNLPGTPSGVNFVLYAETRKAYEIALIEPIGIPSLEVGSKVSVKAKVTDNSGASVSNHPVGFEILGNSGYVGSKGVVTSQKATSLAGIAEEIWILGPDIGTDSLRISAFGQPNQHLQGSPIIVKVTTKAGAPDSGHSTIVAGGQPIAGDSLTITITLADSFNNPVPNKMIQLVPGDANVSIVQDTSTPTNAQGKTTGVIKSDALGKHGVYARSSDTGKNVAYGEFVFVAGLPDSLKLYAGNGQKGNIGTLLPDSLAVLVVDSNGFPVSNVEVKFSTEATGARFLETGQQIRTERTDAQGIAAAHLILGSETGPKTAKAKSSNDNEVYFAQSVLTPVPPYVLADTSGSGQRANKGERLAKPFVVGLRDAVDHIVANALISYTVKSGDGQIIGTNPNPTDYAGRSALYYQFGTRPTNADTVEASNTLARNAIKFWAKAAAGKRLVYVSGDSQKATVTVPLTTPLKLKAIDDYGDPIVGLSIQFQFSLVQGSGAILTPLSSVTNSAGEALTFLTPGQTAGEYKVRATSLSMPGQYVEFTCTAEPDRPSKFEKIYGDGQFGTINRELVYPIRVIVVDKYDNQVPNALVTFVPLQGKVDKTSGTSDQSGLAQCRWTIGSSLEWQANRLFVICSKVDTFLATGVSNNFPLIGNSSESVSIEYSRTFSYTIPAVDADGDPLTYSIQDMPPNAALNPITGEFFWTPTEAQQGEWLLHIQVDDNKIGYEHGFDVDSLKITVTEPDTSTLVELSTFEGSVVPYKGILLNWKTNREIDNLGFDVLRSFSENGQYRKINSGVIKSHADGKYSFTDSTVVAGRKYYYKLEDIDANGARFQHGPVAVELQLPDKFQLLQNYPNPFNPRTTIRFQLPKAAATRISIYNMLGQEVKRIVDRQMQPGYHEVLWDGRNEAGMQVGSGVYYYRIEAEEFRDTKKMAMLR